MASGAAAVAAFIVIAILASLIFAQDPYNPTAPYVNNFPVMNTLTLPKNGLELQASINATTITSGQTVNVTVGDYNTLRAMNNFSASDDWPLKGLNDGSCGTVNKPFGAAVFRGYYTASDVSSAKQLQLYSPYAVYSCPAIFSGISQYSFYPQSYTALVWPSGSAGPTSLFRVRATGLEVNGFWNTVPLIQYSYHTELTPGVYTVAAGDEWGNLLFLYFVVKA